VAGGRIGAIDQQRFKAHDAQMEGHRRQPADTTGHNGHGQQPLPLAGHAAHQPGMEACVESLEARPGIGFRDFLGV